MSPGAHNPAENTGHSECHIPSPQRACAACTVSAGDDRRPASTQPHAVHRLPGADRGDGTLEVHENIIINVVDLRALARAVVPDE